LSSSEARSSARIAERVVAWQGQQGRHDLPWQGTRDPYRIWLSEIMLQQTQVTTVLPYYRRFLARFPDVAHLARASLDDVLALWAGLGYYSRGRHLHRAAQQVEQVWGGVFPTCAADLATLPGVGPSTAAAIAALAFGEQVAILDGNVKRVLSRHRGLYRDGRWESALWTQARAQLPASDIVAYTQGMMDLGATLCTQRRPACERCPIQSDCEARISGDPTQFPGQPQARARPTRQWQFLAVIVDRQVLLEQRPGKGIWPSLWCLPIWLAPSRPVPSSATVAYQYRVDTFQHDFTHFRLHATVHVLMLETADRPVVNAQRWVGRTDLERVGMPAPIARLLRAWLT
jgi:A/G-specific adenine glycosylase